jgi:hypothetical protein
VVFKVLNQTLHLTGAELLGLQLDDDYQWETPRPELKPVFYEQDRPRLGDKRVYVLLKLRLTYNHTEDFSGRFLSARASYSTHAPSGARQGE